MRAVAHVTASGPLLDGTLEREIGRGLVDARGEVGDLAVDMVRGRFDQVLRHDAWQYRSGRRTPGRLRAAVTPEVTGDRVRAHNGNVIYRYWIEGVGSRNRSTRFKGYRTFRLVQQQIRGEARRVVERTVARIVGGLG